MSQRRWVIAALVFLVIGLVALWRSKISMSQTQSVSLRGGASLAYAGVSYGRPEAIPPGENWKRAFSFLPQRALDKFNLTVSAKFPLATNNLMIWFQDFPSNSPFLIQVPNTIVGLADENGAECFAPNFFPWTLMSGPHRSSYQGIVLAAFPRRAKSFKLRFYSAGADPSLKLSLLGEMRVPNPAFDTYPEWQPSSLPACHRRRP